MNDICQAQRQIHMGTAGFTDAGGMMRDIYSLMLVSGTKLGHVSTRGAIEHHLSLHVQESCEDGTVVGDGE